jgi:hypothetical protein
LACRIRYKLAVRRRAFPPTLALAVKVPVRSWHPLSKIVIVLGIAGVAVAWLTDGDGPVESSPVPTRTAAAQGTGDGAAQGNGIELAPDGGAAPRPLVARTLPAEASLAAMVERPLFAPDRRPYDPEVEVAMLPPPEPAEVTADAPAPPAVRFIGSIVEDGGVRALVGDGFNVQSVTMGEEIEGWSVLEIEARRLILGFDDARLELTILE